METVAQALALSDPDIQERLILDIARGDRSLRDIASEYGVSHPAIAKFRKRNLDAITLAAAGIRDAAVTKVATVRENLIVEKAERLRRLETLWDDMDTIRTERGLLAEETRMIGGGDYQREVKVSRFDAPLVAQMRGVLADAAEELGERIEQPNTGPNVLVLGILADTGLRERLAGAFAARGLGGDDAGDVGALRE